MTAHGSTQQRRTQQLATSHRWPSQQELWAALLAYTFSGTPDDTCGTNAGTSTVSDACAADTCTLSSSTGFDTTSCDTTSVAITTTSFTLGCASGYSYSGTSSSHAAPMQAPSPSRTPAQTIPARCQAHLDMTRQVVTPHQQPHDSKPYSGLHFWLQIQ